MFFTPRPVPKRVSGGVVCLMLVMLGVAVFAGFDLMGSVESRGPDKVRATNLTGTADALNVAGVFVTVWQSAIQALTTVITKIVTAWLPTGLLDWLQAVHRVWPSIHRLPGTSPPQPSVA